MEEIVKSIENIIIRENQKLKTELKQELKDELSAELKKDLSAELKKELSTELKKELSAELKKELGQEIQNRFLVFENEYGRKIDAMYDFIMLEKEKNQEKFENLHNLNKRVDKMEIDVFNHERRITDLERERL